jgi:hypothetical protein
LVKKSHAASSSRAGRQLAALAPKPLLRLPLADEAEGEAAGGVLSFTVLEIQRIRVMIGSIDQLAAVVPKGSLVPNAHNVLQPNKLFNGGRRGPR